MRDSPSENSRAHRPRVDPLGGLASLKSVTSETWYFQTWSIIVQSHQLKSPKLRILWYWYSINQRKIRRPKPLPVSSDYVEIPPHIQDLTQDVEVASYSRFVKNSIPHQCVQEYAVCHRSIYQPADGISARKGNQSRTRSIFKEGTNRIHHVHG